MKNRLYLSLLIAILLCFAGWTAHAELQKTSPAKNWEYRVEEENVGDFNALGAQGWELVQVECSRNYCRAYFKRQK